MLEVLNRFAHGFAALPVLQSLKRRGHFPLSLKPVPFEKICSNWGANSGHLRVAFRLLESLGVISSDGHTFQSSASTPFNDSFSSGVADSIFDDIIRIYRIPINALLPDEGRSFVPWIDRIVDRWGLQDSTAADLHDGPVLVPLLLALSRRTNKNAQLILDDLDEPVCAAILRFLEIKQWGMPGGRGALLNDAGKYLFERVPINETVHSYGAMFQRIDELLFGDSAAVFAHNAQGHETHVDRSSNVIGSGFQHGKFFAEMDDIFVEIFNRTPLESQPSYAADMGCGDGALLKRIHDIVRQFTIRGRALDEHPLQMIGLDFNEKALDQTARTLEGIPHLLIRADIGQPSRILDELRSRGIPEDEVLHVRSFLDHDRPFVPPANALSVALRSRVPTHNVSVGPAGEWIQPAAVVESLVRHLEGWSGIINRHGLVLLEVHCLPPAMVRRYFDQSESFHFDAYHGFSLQHLVEAQVFHLALAEVGLFPRSGYSRRFPRTVPFTRITLDWLEKRDYTVRNAVPSDLPALNDLEEQCWPVAMRMQATELAARLDRFPEGQFVLEQHGRVAAVLYSQRLESAAALDSAIYKTLPTLHTADGPVLQLLGLNVAPDAQDQNLGSELADVVTRWCVLRGDIESIVGVTRCKDYQRRSKGSFEEYVWTVADGLPIDPILRFHTSRGASIRKILPGYRPEDTDNLGHGIVIEYQIRDRVESAAVQQPVQVRIEDDIESALAGCIRHLLNPRYHSAYAADVPLREMGMDSLDLMELRILLNRRFQVELDSSFFFEHSTPSAIAKYLAKDVAVPVRRGATARASAPATTAGNAVAIIGMSCRFPGNIETPEAYWETLNAGLTTPNHLENPSFFDSAFFRISPREANHLDPQQRILLEQSWRALEHAGIDPESLAGQPVGVFTGIFSHDYEILSLRGASPREAQPYLATGNAAAVASGRLAYFLDLRGPAISIDTACSSSLVAVHLACQSLCAGDCRIAFASGVNLILTPDLTQTFAEAGMLAKDGKCKTFDAAADGYSRSEGCAVVVLKLLSEAINDGDEILAVIRGSGINQDGASNGLTAPNASAQQAVIRRALENAGVQPHEVSYVEAHGTGTALGDPVEVKALGAVYGEGRSDEYPLLAGSAKTNLGHTEAAAGLAGLIKVVLALRHRHIPRHLHFTKINPNITLDGSKLAIANEARQWVPGATGRRFAGVSSFGFSGTNAHIILEEAPASPVCEADTRPCHLLAISATSESALGQLAGAYADYLDRNPNTPLGEVCATANAGRKHFRHRWTAIAKSSDEMRDALRSVGSSAMSSVEEVVTPKIAFLYTGQGSQYANMGRGLYEVSATFRAAIDRCAGLLGDRLGVALPDLLYGSKSHLLVETRFTQPALFCLEYALTELWRSYGINPVAVAGHSAGEFVAAVTAGILSLEDGLTLIVERARLMQEAPRGAMLVVFASERIVEAAVRGYEREAVVAVYNTPNNVVVSGNEARIASLEESFSQTGIRTLRLNVSHAFHSPLMDGVLEPLRKAAEKIEHRAPTIPFVSNLTGEFAVPTPEYWARHLRNSVRFSQGITTLLQNSCNVFLEIGPRPTLIELGRGCTNQKDIEWISSLRPGHHDWQQMLECLSLLYKRGETLDWRSIEEGTRRRTGLPGHPFTRHSHWLPSASAKTLEATSLLGNRLNSPLQQFESTIASTAFDDHQVNGRPLMPAAAYLELARTAASSDEEIGEIEIEQPLYMAGPVTIQTILTDSGAGSRQLTVYSRHENGWLKHCTAQLVPKIPSIAEPLEAVMRRITRDIDPAVFYRSCAKAGVVYGPAYRNITSLRVGINESLGQIQSSATPEAMLDAALQVALASLSLDEIPLPVSVKRFHVVDSLPGNFWSHARTKQDKANGVLIADVTIYGIDGSVLASVEGLTMRFRAPKRAWEKWLYQVEWKPQPTATIPPTDFPVLTNAGWYAAAAAAVNELSISFVEQALQKLGGPDSRQQVHTRHRKLFDRLLRVAQETAPHSNHHEPLAQLAAVRARFPEASAELDLLERCGSNLAAVLRGDRDPVELLFPNGDTSACRRLYAESPAFADRNAALAQVVSAAASTHPGRIRILEIGAGTGAATEAILPHLPADRTDYTFTDVSGLFLALAAERFRDYPFLTYRQLDIENPQEFEPHSFDILIASNVLHATGDLAQSLRNAKRLLAPGGMLALLEVSQPQLWIDLVFGLLDGWWRFTDSDLRPEYPLLSANGWQALLEREGFTATSVISGEPGVYDQVVLTSKAPAKHRNWLMVNAGKKLARELESSNVQVTNTPVSIASSLVSEPCNQFDDIIYLGGKDEPAWSGALELVQSMISGKSQSRLWLVTHNAVSVEPGDPVSGFSQATLWGLGKVISQEHPEFRCTLLDLDDDRDRASNLASELLRTDDKEREIAIRRRVRHVARLVPWNRPATQSVPVEPFRLEASRFNGPDSLELRPASRRAPGKGEIEIRVIATGLNFRDVLTAMGMYPGDPSPFGVECSGTVERIGDDVTGFRPGDEVIVIGTGTFCQFVTVSVNCAVLNPKSVSAIDAAGVAIPFLTASHALEELGQMKAGDRVLIHSAAGGVGLAAVQLARRAGAEVYATASESKWNFLRSQGVQHVYDSRAPDFADCILKETGGAGVDIVLNSLTGELARRSLALLRGSGHFIDISKSKRTPEQTGPRYYRFDLLELPPAKLQQMLCRLANDLERGEFHPVPTSIYPMTEVANAFDKMRQATHIGKIVVTQRSIDAQGTYLITGGAGGLGLAVAQYLIEQGAKRVILVGRRAPKATLPTQAEFRQGDVTRSEDVARILDEIAASGYPLRGVIHAAGVLDDAMLAEQNPDRFRMVLDPKVTGAWNLHQLTRDVRLEFFILFSSIASVTGSPGQANHAAANAFLDSLAAYRRAFGLPAMSINWGAWSGIGSAAGTSTSLHLKSKGLEAMTPAEGIAAFSQMLRSQAVQAVVLPMDWGRFFDRHNVSPYFDFLREQRTESEMRSEKRGLITLVESAPETQRHSVMLQELRGMLRNVLGMASSAPVPPKQGFFELGLDSLGSVQLRNMLQKQLNRPLPSSLLFDYPNLDVLTSHLLAAASGADSSGETGAASAHVQAEDRDLDSLSEEEAERILLERLEQIGSA